ncbi:hypothetical protein NA57DRAFT_74892 [Rhizodiscina lignyota]|uniref:C3H1-type domain-containing protein n=1 Tax=Rhizodiscina lignyota TaxID=1504668 RepID=A0A9P4IJN8_9PEZI|nr:hypothetical protein NA57DRAFT_74892 [Rhizodiscina lignyota]
MSSFAFPPPPPPPPKATSSDAQNHSSNRSHHSSSRGNRGGYNNFSGRGRGRGQGQRGRGAWNGYRGGSHANHGGHTAVNLAAGVKRKHPDALDAQNGGPNDSSLSAQPRKLNVAPAVPTFGFQFPTAPLNATAQPTPIATQQERHNGQPEEPKEKKQIQQNQLGLTPKSVEQEHSDPEIVEAEEATLLGQAYVDNPNLPNLNSPAAIATWLAERRKRYPTKARMEEKRKAERQAELDRLKQKVIESQKAKAAQEQKLKDAQKEKDAKLQSKLEKAERKAGKLRQQLLQRQTAADKEDDSEETQTSTAAPSTAAPSKANLGLNYDSDSVDGIDDERKTKGDDAGSSSDSDDSSSDEAPDQESSQAPATAPAPHAKAWHDVPDYLMPFVRNKYCKFFLLNGYCGRKNTCMRKHDLPKPLQDHQGKRPKLYDRLVEQELCKRDAAALQAIKFLGNSGFFDDS